MKIIEENHNNDRLLAMAWWNNLALEMKFYCMIPWLKIQGLNTTSRHPDSLTGREIEEIWKRERKL